MPNNFSDILEYSASRFPDNIAIIDGDRTVCYEELNFNVYSMARCFLDLGLKSGDRVISLLPNCIENVITNFATAKIWCTLAPLNTDIKLSELDTIIGHIDPKILIVHASVAPLIDAMDKNVAKGLTVIWVGKSNRSPMNFDDLINKYSRLDIPYPKEKEDKLCSIIYTSGTSGNKKGVMRTHENNLWSVISISIHRQYKPGELELFVLPMYSIAFYNVFCPNLLCGSTVFILKSFDRRTILSLIEHHSVNRIYLLPFMWSILIADDNSSKYNLSALKQIMVGAAPLSIETKSAIMQAFPDAILYESWGMTEGGHIALEPEDNLRKLGSIGKPLCFNEMKIVDEHGYKVPPGMVGEIIIRGKSITKGYYLNPEETQKCFPKNDGWFYTGDLARYDNEGYFYLTGRKSEIIIFGENKIHPQEVEEAILLHPGISEAVVFGYPDREWGEIVVAAIAKRNGADVSRKDINDLLEKYIADYKKPKHIMFIEEIPKSPTGKTNKALLINSIRQQFEKKWHE
jgi:acyl-CoA synthetase (AMP-forming)/AMP-acid ligase II